MAELSDNQIPASIVLNVMGLRELAVYGFRSWMLQDFQRPYEVILNLFYPCKDMFEPLVAGKNPNCNVRINQVDEPEFFNISAANNLGLHLSNGKYVFFANADVIYPGPFLTRALVELERRNLCYAIASRLNMTAADTAKLKPAMSYTLADPFIELSGMERTQAYAGKMYPISPWMIRRDIARAIGGFDARILMAEDRDLNHRLPHYLRRTGQQECIVGLIDLCGYHQEHSSSGIFDAWTQSKAIMEPREKRLLADPNSQEDIAPTRLDDYDALMADIRNTKKPPVLNQYREDLGGKVSRRAKKVWNALVYGK